MPDRTAGPWDYDVHYVARGIEECNAMVAQGWEVYEPWIVEEEIRRSTVQLGRVVRPTPYFFLGRKLTKAQRESGEIVRQAAEAADLEPPQPAQPDDPEGDPEDDTKTSRSTPAETKDDPPAVPARRGQTTRLQPAGSRGHFEAEGIRTGGR